MIGFHSVNKLGNNLKLRLFINLIHLYAFTHIAVFENILNSITIYRYAATTHRSQIRIEL